MPLCLTSNLHQAHFPPILIISGKNTTYEVLAKVLLRVFSSLFPLQKDEVYLNLVLDFVPETVYRVARHFNKAKTTIPIIYVKVGKHSEGTADATWAQFSFCFRVFRRCCFIWTRAPPRKCGYADRDLGPGDQGVLTHSGPTTGRVVSLDGAPLLSKPGELTVGSERRVLARLS